LHLQHKVFALFVHCPFDDVLGLNAMQEFVLDFFVEPLRVILDQVSFVKAVVLKALESQVVDVGVFVYNLSLVAGRVVVFLYSCEVDSEL
jgi:hypothetical protein